MLKKRTHPWWTPRTEHQRAHRVLARDTKRRRMNSIREPERSKEAPKARRLLSLQQVAELLGVSTASVRRLLSAGQLPFVRFNRRLLVDVKDLDAFIEQAKQRASWS
jgi:excisionase family DNA binding protein